MDQGCQPGKVNRILDNLANSHNVFAEDQEDRAEWVEDMDEPPDHGYEKDHAEVVYFTGCVASCFPLAQQIPVALAKVRTRPGWTLRSWVGRSGAVASHC